ncbi:hypothetical protein ABZR88_17440 [Mucilaginibacter yixingensis]|nr:hypothetical protein [Mucilaginibacter yixingensis]
MTTLRNYYKDVLLGVAVGDALGVLFKGQNLIRASAGWKNRNRRAC